MMFDSRVTSLSSGLAALLLFASASRIGRPQEPAKEQARGPLLLAVEGKGDQVYQCTGGVWTLVRPDAVLLDAKGAEVGKHGAGPYWEYKDGSMVRGEVVSKKPAPGASDIPWLLLRADAHSGGGVLSQVETIERTGTHGGQAPEIGCDADHVGVELRVPYTAGYTFYGRPGKP